MFFINFNLTCLTVKIKNNNADFQIHWEKIFTDEVLILPYISKPRHTQSRFEKRKNCQVTLLLAPYKKIGAKNYKAKT